MKQNDFHVERGQSRIRILSDGLCNTLSIKRPAAANWPDLRGSIGEYYAVSGLNPEISNLMAEQFNAVLLNADDPGILHHIPGFLELFAPGTYQVEIHPALEQSWTLNFCDPRPTGDQQEWFAYNFYPSSHFELLASQPESLLNLDRVDFYRERIRSGARPRALLYRHLYPNLPEEDFPYYFSQESGVYILDGHHKLAAYQAEKIPPAVVFILKSEDQKDLKSSLFPYLEYWLPEGAMGHLISHRPEMRLPEDEAEERYNYLLDRYLSSCSRVETEVLNLFKQAWKSEDPVQRAWLDQRLQALGSKIDRKRNLWLNYLVSKETSVYRGLAWEGMRVTNQKEWETWKALLLREPYL